MNEAALESSTRLFPYPGHKASKDLLDSSDFPIYTVSSGLLDHEFHKTLGGLSETWEESYLTKTQNSPGNLRALGQ